MEEKKSLKLSLVTVLLIIAIIVLVCYIYIEKTNPNKEIDNVGTSNNVTQSEENIVLYKGIQIATKPGVQNLLDMEVNDESNKKYNTTFYNYENGKYEGATIGEFGEETYEGVSVVQNVKRIAMTQKYNAIPRNYTTIEELPKQLIDMADCSSVDIQSIDLDNDGKTEYLICYTVNYAEGEIGDGEPEASSGIMILDFNYKKIADLVLLENGFWGNIKKEDNKIFLSLNDVEYVDIDNDGIMEVIINVPTYEGSKISIIEYNNGNIEGETDLIASVLP